MFSRNLQQGAGADWASLDSNCSNTWCSTLFTRGHSSRQGEKRRGQDQASYREPPTNISGWKKLKHDSLNDFFKIEESKNHENVNQYVLALLNQLYYANILGYEEEEDIFVKGGIVNSYHYLEVCPSTRNRLNFNAEYIHRQHGYITNRVVKVLFDLMSQLYLMCYML